MSEQQQINVRSPNGHLHLSRRYGEAPWKLRGKCPANELAGLIESALEVVERLVLGDHDGEPQVTTATEPARSAQGKADAVASHGHEATQEGRAPSESMSDDDYRTHAETMLPWWRAKAEKAKADVQRLLDNVQELARDNSANADRAAKAEADAALSKQHVEDIAAKVGELEAEVAEQEQAIAEADTLNGRLVKLLSAAQDENARLKDRIDRACQEMAPAHSEAYAFSVDSCCCACRAMAILKGSLRPVVVEDAGKETT